MALEKISYANVSTLSGPTVVKAGPAGWFGFTVAAGTAVSVAVYDGTTVGGTPLYTKASHVAGDVVHFGGTGIAAKSGLFVVVGGDASAVNFLYT